MKDLKKREEWLDIAKGLGIILVVLGHSFGNDKGYYNIIYWFHMPAFFIFSGFLFKPAHTIYELKKLIYKRSIQLLVPYISIAIIITIFRYSVEIMNANYNLNWYIKDLAHIVAGGTYATGYYGVFWFITCLFVTQVLFATILLFVKKRQYVFIILLISYILAHLEAKVVSDMGVSVPLGIDITLLAVVYFAFGYFGEKLLKEVNVFQTIISLAIFSSVFLLNKYNFINYSLDMKYVKYTNIILDLIVPIAITLLLVKFSQLIFKLNFLNSTLSSLGLYSLIIMYLHKPINYVLSEFVSYNDFVYVLVGVLIPLFITKMLIKKTDITRFLFLGSNPSIKLRLSKKVSA